MTEADRGEVRGDNRADAPRGRQASRGAVLCVDVGEVRVGVAISDPARILATPLITLKRDRARNGDLTEIVRIVSEREIVEVVVGLPRLLSGAHGSAASIAQRYAARLARRIAPVPVHLHDERMTSVIAGRTLSEQGVRGKRQRAVVDQVAAVVILQSWLDAASRHSSPAATAHPEDSS
ncbi:MAG TPA: Holliday junction resolvase RuvX [Mycobacteriales bacterium]|jgi:putative Holliday junction resolvase|nr:Holliday junction resolvase RuvX [Mycobacteriales bacterium]